MNTESATSSLQSKIQKMLALAQRGGTEAEANTAMHMVLELLAKHNLSMSDITNTEVQDEDISQFKFDGDSNAPWQRIVWMGIAHLYFCRYYFSTYTMTGKKYVTHVVTGKPSNMRIVTEVATYIVQLGEELARGKTAHGETRSRKVSHRESISVVIARSKRHQPTSSLIIRLVRL